MEKVLRINVGAENGPVATIEELGAYAGLGGRAMTTTVVCNEVPPNCHPLGPENKLVFSPGLMAGSAAASSGRISVGCKSPLTGTIKESNSGGTGGQFMARLGYAAIIIEGERKTDDLWKIVITKDSVTFEKCNEYRMLSNYPLVAALQEKYGMEPGYVTIGTAGEMLMCNSTICFTDPEGRATRHAGRGGVGAVMGSKGIKAIVLDPAGTPVIRKPKNAEAFKAASRAFAQGLSSHPVCGTGLPTYGTNVLVNILNEAGGLPTKNFSVGRFEGADKICAETMVEIQKRITRAIKIWSAIENDPRLDEWNFRIVGEGPDLAMYKQLAQTLGLKRISFEGFRNPQPYYKQAAIFMMTSAFEGFPMTLVEAQQCGVVPVVMDSYLSLHDIVETGYNGIIVSNEDLTGYVNKIKELMTDTSLREKLAMNGLHSCRRFCVEEIVNNWEELFNDLSANRR